MRYSKVQLQATTKLVMATPHSLVAAGIKVKSKSTTRRGVNVLLSSATLMPTIPGNKGATKKEK